MSRFSFSSPLPFSSTHSSYSSSTQLFSPSSYTLSLPPQNTINLPPPSHYPPPSIHSLSSSTSSSSFLVPLLTCILPSLYFCPQHLSLPYPLTLIFFPHQLLPLFLRHRFSFLLLQASFFPVPLHFLSLFPLLLNPQRLLLSLPLLFPPPPGIFSHSPSFTYSFLPILLPQHLPLPALLLHLPLPSPPCSLSPYLDLYNTSSLTYSLGHSTLLILQHFPLPALSLLLFPFTSPPFFLPPFSSHIFFFTPLHLPLFFLLLSLFPSIFHTFLLRQLLSFFLFYLSFFLLLFLQQTLFQSLTFT